MKGYKAFDENLKCRDMSFKVGKTYKIDGKIELCQKGFHFCENLFDVYSYYPKESKTRICEIEAIGEVLKDGDKSVTSEIKIIRELLVEEKLELWIKRTNSGDRNSGDGNSGDRNSGYGNSGDRNSGNRNSGDWNSGYGNSGNRNSGDGNSGDWNSGDGNSGDWNSGDWNSGYGNSGDRNSGYGNSGNRNSGYGNSGNRNSGDWNSGDGNSGYFNTVVPLYLFNKPSSTTYTSDLEYKMRSLNVKPIVVWVSTDSMTETEKNDNPSHKTTGGFLRKTNRHDWRYLTDKDKAFIKGLEGFDDTIFKVISNGVSLLDDMIEIVVNGVTKSIKKEDAKKLGLIE